ncbi:MAG TPA: alpha/beta fold hydrolase [Blastocatellia bacterium]|nr:alpha/beta fold hydrolase [Blastocatellia bacterium]
MKKIRINSIDSPLELACRDEGAGQPVIFLHAFPLSQQMWNEQAAALSQTNRVITFDWRGFGESELRGDRFAMDLLAEDLAGLMNEIGIDRAVVCGLSMGGYAAFAFYRKYADRVKALILADTRAGADNEEGKRARLEMAELALQSGASAVADRMIHRLLAPVTLQNKPAIAERVRAIIAGNRPETIAAAQRGMAERPDSTELLATISCPTLIIVGSDDALTSPNEAEKMRDQISDAGLVVISEAGHLSNLEQPDDFNRAVANFLKQL